ncbi:unnamed protein product [Notodromas monacha]|uniref:Uncharacterized protein n=1 Tax=Notodromas monacha TaxID=399045 RepID=A0A7R9BCM2_9CRUS|nr:unnamed protein product [Notodromas monacha]CAG0912869.1 unnamed protein product [Notodromas monacha]
MSATICDGCQRLVPMLDNSTDSDVLLRLITFVANLCSAVKRLRVTPADIPPMDKVASPETMYARIYGVAVFDRLQDKVRVVSRFNACEEIRFHANRIIDAFREEGEK